MSHAAAAVQKVELDLSDVKHRLGQEVGGGEPIEPVSATDIRRWVMAMDYFNPIHWDDQFARDSKFGDGATMGAWVTWVTDYIAHWAGHDGFVRYSNTSFRGPSYEGDVTYIDEKKEDSMWGEPLVSIAVKMTNQDGNVLATGKIDVELARCRRHVVAAS